MSKPKAQGTRWETELVRRAHDRGLMADRIAEGGLNDRGDVWLVNPPGDTSNTHVAVAWKRLTGSSAHRSPDGIRDGVFIPTDQFLELIVAHSYINSDIGWIVECKATQTLNVTRTLAKAQRKAMG